MDVSKISALKPVIFNLRVKEWSFTKKAALLITGVGTLFAGIAITSTFTVTAVVATVGLVITAVMLYSFSGKEIIREVSVALPSEYVPNLDTVRGKFLSSWLEQELVIPYDYKEEMPSIGGYIDKYEKAVYINKSDNLLVASTLFFSAATKTKNYKAIIDDSYPNHSYLSNQNPDPVTIGKKEYQTREHAVQSMKFNDFGMPKRSKVFTRSHSFMVDDQVVREMKEFWIEEGKNVRDFLACIDCSATEIKRVAKNIEKFLKREFPNSWQNYLNNKDIDRVVREQKIIMAHAFLNEDGTPNALGKKLVADTEEFIFEVNNRKSDIDQVLGVELIVGEDDSITLKGHNILGLVLMELQEYLTK